MSLYTIPNMKPISGISRREFIAGTSALLMAGELSGQDTNTAKTVGDAAEKLALEGGEKAVKKAATKPIRWGDPEREQFGEMLKQDSLLYWKAPQTTLLIKRFKEHCPLEHVMTCSSGT